MAKQLKSAHAELDELRQAATGERMKQRELETALEAAKVEVEQASAAIADGFAAEDERAVTQARKTEEDAVAKVRELQHRVDGAALRVERAQAQLDGFLRERSRDLLAEREQPARTVAAELTAAGHELLRLHRAYLAERMAIDQLVAATPGASPRSDGPAARHAWERPLRELERAIREVPEVPALTPSWSGLKHRKQQDEVGRLLRKEAA